MALTEKKNINDKASELSSVSDEQIEVVADRHQSTAAEVTELSAIEATAASKAAWLISVTVSTGGFLFGMVDARYPRRLQLI
jgi:MFS transporter, SP family, solute carrier family 2 (myo-inositol transporter), member 13